MSQTLINTLRFADRLKEAGFAGAQAEALARVLGDELTEQLPSKADFQTLQADFKALRPSLTPWRPSSTVRGLSSISCWHRSGCSWRSGWLNRS